MTREELQRLIDLIVSEMALATTRPIGVAPSFATPSSEATRSTAAPSFTAGAFPGVIARVS